MDKPAILSNPEAFVVVPADPDRIAWLDADDNPKMVSCWFPASVRAPFSDIEAYCAELEARLAEAERVIDQQSEALAPVANTISYNSYGDMVKNYLFRLTDEHCVSAHFADRAARTWKENGNG